MIDVIRQAALNAANKTKTVKILLEGAARELASIKESTLTEVFTEYVNDVADMIKKYNIKDVYVVVGDLHAYSSGFLLTQLSNQLGDK